MFEVPGIDSVKLTSREDAKETNLDVSVDVLMLSITVFRELDRFCSGFDAFELAVNDVLLQ